MQEEPSITCRKQKLPGPFTDIALLLCTPRRNNVPGNVQASEIWSPVISVGGEDFLHPAQWSSCHF